MKAWVLRQKNQYFLQIFNQELHAVSMEELRKFLETSAFASHYPSGPQTTAWAAGKGEVVAVVDDTRRLSYLSVDLYCDLYAEKPEPEFLSPLQYANKHNKKRQIVQRLCREGRLPGARCINGCWWIPSATPYPERLANGNNGNNGRKNAQESDAKGPMSAEQKMEIVQYVLQGHTLQEAADEFNVSLTPVQHWVRLYQLHGEQGLEIRPNKKNDYDDAFRAEVLRYKRENNLSLTQTALEFCLDVQTVSRWVKKFKE